MLGRLRAAVSRDPWIQREDLATYSPSMAMLPKGYWLNTGDQHQTHQYLCLSAIQKCLFVEILKRQALFKWSELMSSKLNSTRIKDTFQKAEASSDNLPTKYFQQLCNSIKLLRLKHIPAVKEAYNQ